MPELPEVESFRQKFLHGSNENPSLVGRRILSVVLLWEPTLASPTPKEFITRIVDQTIRGIDRRGKYLLIRLSDDVLAIHLRMSGDLLVEATTEIIAKHHRLLLNLDDGTRLAFNDTRKFGRVWLTEDIDTLLCPLGPEPLDQTFTQAVFYAKLQTRNRQIKPLLLDQHFLAGLGNIYTDEALFWAGIHPQTIAKSISFQRVQKLWTGIRSVLQEGIRSNGASIDWVYRGGDYQNYFQVYGRTGEACTRCNTPIERIIVGQRSTHFCPNCQPKQVVVENDRNQ
jgi:formamidopyrimidine-DNA glycosylase